MRVDKKTGLLERVRQVPSPNCDARPDGCVPELLVVHAISLPPGEYGGPWIDRFFTKRLEADAHPYFAEIVGMSVSAHLLIRRDGEIVQYVPFDMRAWHAGESAFASRTACNDFSIGIELEGTDEEPYRASQYIALARAYLALAGAYPALAGNPVVGHSDIAPGRKTDPGPYFEWSRFARLVTEFGGRPLTRTDVG